MNAIEIKDLSFTYRRSDRPALADLNFSQREGEVVALAGRTGAGKSSLVLCLNRIIPGFFPGEFKGRIRLFGEDIAGRRTGDLAGQVGVVLQDFESQLFSTRADLDAAFGPENLGLPREEIAARVRGALLAVGLADFAGRDPATLSGGQKQRLALASVLALKPKILCLDEATTDLDPLAKAEVMAIARKLAAGGSTLILIGHEAEEFSGADRIVILEQGRVKSEGPRDEILADAELLGAAGVRPGDAVQVAAGLKLNGLRFQTAGTVLDKLRENGFSFDQDKVRELEQQDQERDQKLGAEVLRVENIEYRYPSGVQALAGVSLSIRQGDFVALVGANGSGKTTLTKNLNGLLRPTAGAVFLDGHDLAGRKLAELGQEIGFGFQNPDHQIFSSRVFDEVAFGPRNYGFSAAKVKERVKRALAAVNLSGAEDRDPFLMTKGERQRLAVASILAPEPRVLILDEPTTGLDFPEQAAVMEMLCELNRAGRTVIIVTHTLWLVARYARRAVLMTNGKILADGPTRRVLSQSDLLPRASLRMPEIMQMGIACGFPTLTAEEFLRCAAKTQGRA